ncbi:janus kinase and microtubule-interacting protein 3-like [Liolophura sinensis]|uniref:janus kinase and microtubule-interacting protein 3-like n=1 Tax=Liolophura sinensis TaxID=3198878 RepID=UPI0031597342
MESCPTVCLLPNRTAVKRADDSVHRSVTVYATLGNLVHVETCDSGSEGGHHKIEELKSKDRIISQLERQLGHSASAVPVPPDKWSAQSPALKTSPSGETTCDKDLSSQACGKNGGKDSSQPEDGLASNAFHLPPIEDTSDKKRVVPRVPSLERCLEEEKRRTHALTEQNAILMKRLSEMERRSKPLQDRSKKYVEKSMELTSVKRCLEDQLKALSEENRKLKEHCEQSRRKLSHVTRQLTQERSDKEGLEDQTSEIEDLYKQLTEQNKVIAALKQTCSEKDRRIELIQYRKRRRRQERSQEMLAGVKETAYGYDEDNQSVDSEVSSLSFDNSLDDDSWDEFAKEEFQQNYRRLAREHLDLEKSYALLQCHSDMCQDPQRENKSRSALESDLFKAQCKIENLEKFLKLSGKDSNWLVEKETLQTDNKELENRVSYKW